MNTVVYVILGASILLAIAVLIQLKTLLVAAVSLNGKAIVRAAITTSLLIGIATILALYVAGAPGLILPHP